MARPIVLLLLAAMMLGCGQQRGLAPQDTSIDQTPAWARGVEPPPDRTGGRRGLGAVLAATPAQGAAARRLGRRNPWIAHCGGSVAEALVACTTLREVRLGSRIERVGIAIAGSEGSEGSVTVFTGNDWPSGARSAVVRVDHAPPVQLTRLAPQEAVVRQMLTGDVVHVSRWHWPQRDPIEFSAPLDGLQEALEALLLQAEHAGFRLRPTAER